MYSTTSLSAQILVHRREVVCSSIQPSSQCKESTAMCRVVRDIGPKGRTMAQHLGRISLKKGLASRLGNDTWPQTMYVFHFYRPQITGTPHQHYYSSVQLLEHRFLHSHIFSWPSTNLSFYSVDWFRGLCLCIGGNGRWFSGKRRTKRATGVCNKPAPVSDGFVHRYSKIL